MSPKGFLLCVNLKMDPEQNGKSFFRPVNDIKCFLCSQNLAVPGQSQCLSLRGLSWWWAMDPTPNWSWSSSSPHWLSWCVQREKAPLFEYWKSLRQSGHCACDSGSLCVCLGCRVWLTECLCFSLQLLEGNFALFCSSTLGFRNDFQNILLIIMVSTHTRTQTQRWHLQSGSLVGALFPWQWAHETLSCPFVWKKFSHQLQSADKSSPPRQTY